MSTSTNKSTNELYKAVKEYKKELKRFKEWYPYVNDGFKTIQVSHYFATDQKGAYIFLNEYNNAVLAFIKSKPKPTLKRRQKACADFIECANIILGYTIERFKKDVNSYIHNVKQELIAINVGVANEKFRNVKNSRWRFKSTKLKAFNTYKQAVYTYLEYRSNPGSKENAYQDFCKIAGQYHPSVADSMKQFVTILKSSGSFTSKQDILDSYFQDIALYLTYSSDDKEEKNKSHTKFCELITNAALEQEGEAPINYVLDKTDLLNKLKSSHFPDAQVKNTNITQTQPQKGTYKNKDGNIMIQLLHAKPEDENTKKSKEEEKKLNNNNAPAVPPQSRKQRRHSVSDFTSLNQEKRTKPNQVHHSVKIPKPEDISFSQLSIPHENAEDFNGGVSEAILKSQNRKPMKFMPQGTNTQEINIDLRNVESLQENFTDKKEQQQQYALESSKESFGSAATYKRW